jgi:hypothetical protein
MMIRDRSLPMKMGGLLSLISDDILFIGLFGGDDMGFWFGDDIGINGDMMDLELAILELLTEWEYISFRSDMISSKLS